MTTSATATLHPIFNPDGAPPFCPDQTDFLCFKGREGFSAVDLNLIEGFTAGHDGIEEYTTIQLTNNNQYDAIESVPTLVNRYAGVKRLRYMKERQDTEIVHNHPLTVTPPAASPVPVKVESGDGKPGGIWKNAPAGT